MISFWTIAIILTIISLLGLFWPFLKKHQADSNLTREQLNQIFYQLRLEELDRERELGVISESDEITASLQRSLLDDIPTETVNNIDSKKNEPLVTKKLLIFFCLLLILISYSAYFKAGHFKIVKEWQELLSQSPKLSVKLSNDLKNRQNTLTEKEISDLKLIIRTQLQQNPNEKEAWLLLSNLGARDNDFETYLFSAERAYALDPSSRLAQKTYAEAQLMSDDTIKKQSGLALYNRYLLKYPNDLTVLSQLAFYYFNQNQPELAIEYWEKILSLTPPEDEQYQMIKRAISMTKEQIKG